MLKSVLCHTGGGWLLVIGLLGACQPTDSLLSPASPISVTQASPVQEGERGILPIRDRIRAIAARERLEKSQRTATEPISRHYDRLGRVTSEVVRIAGKSYVRPSTMPSAISNRPLSDFLPPGRGQGALLQGGTLTAVSHAKQINGISVTFHDSLWAVGEGAVNELVRDASDSNYVMLGTIFHPDSASLSSLTSSHEGDLFVVEEGNIAYYEIFGSDWQDGVALMVADTTGEGLLRESPPSLRLTGGVGLSSLMISCVVLGRLPQELNCEGEERTYYVSVAGAAASMAVGLYVCKNPLNWLNGKCSRAVGLVDGMVAAVTLTYALYVECLTRQPELRAGLPETPGGDDD